MSKPRPRGASRSAADKIRKGKHMDRISAALAEVVIVGSFGGTLAICLYAVLGVI